MTNNNEIKYGWVPFTGFQIVMWGFIIVMLVYYKLFRELIRKAGLQDSNKNIDYYRMLIFSIPLFIIAYNDVKYSSFSFRNIFNIFNADIQKYNHSINYTLRIFGCYGIIQVLAQDIGVKTGKSQANIVKNPIIQWFLYFCTAFSIVNNRSEAMIGATLYFIMKYDVSDNETQNVCFEDV